MGDIVFGLHSDSEETSNPFKKNAGHTWISITTPDGFTTTYGLWVDTHERVIKLRQQNGWDGSGTAVRQNLEYGRDKYPSSKSTFWKISDKQYRIFEGCLSKPQSYNAATNNCATWAAKVTGEVTGERVYSNSVVTPFRVKAEINRINAERELKSKEVLTADELKHSAGEIKRLDVELAKIRNEIRIASVYEKLISAAPSKVLDKVNQKHVYQKSNELEM